MCNLISTADLCPTCGKPKIILDKYYRCEANSDFITGKASSVCIYYREQTNTTVADSECIQCIKNRTTAEQASSSPRDSDKEQQMQELTEATANSMRKEMLRLDEEISDDDRNPDDDHISVHSDVSSLSVDEDDEINTMRLTSEDALGHDDDLFNVQEFFDEEDWFSFPRHETRVEQLRRCRE